MSNPESRSKIKLVAGWFQMSDGDNSVLEELAKTAKQNRKAFRTKYGSTTTLYAFHVDEFKPEWSKKITFNKDYLSSLPNQELTTSLMWIIKTQNYSSTEEEPHMEAHPIYEPVIEEVNNEFTFET